MVDESRPHRKPIRLDAAVYSVGGWLCSVTICTANRFPIFRNADLTRTCIDLLRSRAEATSVEVHAYCFMPDHLHLLLAASPTTSILDFVRDYKSRSTRVAWQHGIKSALWQERYYDHFLRKDEDVRVAVKYIVNNPVRKELASGWGEYGFAGSFVYELWPSIQTGDGAQGP